MESVTVPGALPEENKLLQPTTISIFQNKLQRFLKKAYLLQTALQTLTMKGHNRVLWPSQSVGSKTINIKKSWSLNTYRYDGSQ